MHLFHSSDFTAAERGVLLITCPSHFFCHFFMLVFPAVTMPLVASLGVPLEQIVRLSFFMYLLFGLGALPAGFAVDRWQARGMLLIGLFVMGLGLFLAGTLTDARFMRLGLAMVGLGASVYHPAGLALISRTVRRRGHALGVNGVFGNLGIASAPLVTGILTWALSWRAAFAVIGAVGMLTSAVLSFVHVDEKSLETSRDEAADGGRLMRYFAVLCAALVFAGVAYRGNILLLPAYLELKTTFFARAIGSLSFIKPQGTATLAATVLTSAVLLSGIFGQLFGGRLADRFDLRKAYVSIHAASFPFILAMAFTSEAALAICAALYIFFSLGMQPIENSLIAALTPSRWRSTSFALKFILNFGLGSTAVYVIAPIKRAFSLETVYVFLAGSTLLLVAGAAFLALSSRSIRNIRN